MNLSVVNVYDNTMEANLAKGKLLSAGIQCFISDENIARLNPIYVQAIGGVRLYVLKQDEALARELLKPDPDYVLENSCPVCGSADVVKVNESKDVLNWIGLLLAAFTRTPSVYSKKINYCNHCKMNLT